MPKRACLLGDKLVNLQKLLRRMNVLKTLKNLLVHKNLNEHLHILEVSILISSAQSEESLNLLLIAPSSKLYRNIRVH